MNKTLKSVVAVGLFALLVQGAIAVEGKPKEKVKNIEKTEEIEVDNRVSLGFTAAEKHLFLKEMRQMLVSLQGIMAGIGAEDREMIIKSARYSGNRMARETPVSIKDKTPKDFDELGGPTHMKFEEIVIVAEDDDMDSIAELTADLMQNCIACHAMYKVD